jgi:short-subunit dehydrogenase
MSHKIAVITGASQGLGLSMAKQLASEGYTPVLLARTQAKLDDAVKAIEDAGNSAASYAVDISDSEKMKEVAEKIKKEYGKIDFLINNAGVFHTELLENLEIEEIKQDLDVSLFGAILCSKLFVPMLKDGGKILFVSSGFGLMGPAGYSTYAASKAGMINFAESLKRELHKRKIGVYVTVPSDIDTPAFREEEKNMPEWMNVSGARGDVMPADAAAFKILGRCRGNRFFIFSHFDVFMLYILTKLLPKGFRDKILDGMFPRP